MTALDLTKLADQFRFHVNSLQEFADSLPESQRDPFTNRLQAILSDTNAIDSAFNTESAIVQRTRELTAMNAIIMAVTNTLKLSEALDTLAEVLEAQLNVPGGAIYRYHETQDLLTMEASWGLPSGTVAAFETLCVMPFGNKQHHDKDSADLAFDLVEIEQMLPQVLNQTHPEWKSCLCIPLHAQGNVQGIIYLFSANVAPFGTDQVKFFNAIGSQVGIAIYNARLYEEVQQGRVQLQMLSWRLVEVQEAERRHIARELHDEVGQFLTGLKLVLEAATRLPQEAAARSLQEAQDIINSLITRVRDLSLDLRPVTLDNLGLLPALIWHIERYTAQTRVNVNLSHSDFNERFAPEIETAAYRIVQEALTNVARHAQIDEVEVRIWSQDDWLYLAIEDHGIGFDTARMANSSGLTGMRERAVLLGGRLKIDTTPDIGTTVTATLPLLKPESIS